MLPMRIFSSLFFLFLVSCGGDWESGELGSTVTHCYSDPLPAGRSVIRAAIESDGSALYVLDNWSTVYKYNRHPVRSCGWELDYNWQTEGRWNQPGFVQDIDYTPFTFAFQDGAMINVSTGWECRAESGSLALAPGGTSFAIGTGGGVRIWSQSGTGCTRTNIVGSLPVWAVAQDAQGLYTVEGVGMLQNLVSYSRSGGEIWREPLSVQENNPKNFCSADRLRVGTSGIYLLDKTCNRLGVFNTDGTWRKTLDLVSLGIYSPLDIMPGEYGALYILIQNQQELTVRLTSLLF